MSAETTLRKAAALMRERAQAASTDGALGWAASGTSVETAHACSVGHGCEPIVYLGGDSARADHRENRANAVHIASWHPAVALAVADWLDDIAEKHRPETAEVAQEDCARCGPDDDCEGHDEECCWYCVGQWEEYAVRVLYPCHVAKAALAVANAYLNAAVPHA